MSFRKLQTGGTYRNLLNFSPQSDNTRLFIPSINKTIGSFDRKELNKEIRKVVDANQKEIKRRKDAIKKSNNSKPFSKESFINSAAGDKLRFFPNDPNSFIDENINPFKMIGDMADNLSHSWVGDGSIGEKALSVVVPLTAGALGSIGTKNIGQFVNNMVNPFAGINIGDKTEFKQFAEVLKNKWPSKIQQTEAEKLYLNNIRNIGNILKGKDIIENPIKALKLIKEKSINIPDDEFKNLTGFNKSEIDNKIATKKNGKNSEYFITIEPNRSRLRDYIRTSRNNNNFQNLFQNNSFTIPAERFAEYINYNGNFSDYANSYINNIESKNKKSLIKKLTEYVDNTVKESDMPVAETLISSLHKTPNNNPAKDILKAFNTVKNAKKGESFIPAHSLSSDSYSRISLPLIKKAIKDNLVDLNYHGFSILNGLGFPEKAKVDPNLLSKEINSYISEINHLTGKKYPFAKVDGDFIQYPQFTVTRKQTGGTITNTGYLPNSPDRFNSYNIIPSNNITMKGVKFPILGISDKNEKIIMQPGKNYIFPKAKYVAEFPLKKYLWGDSVVNDEDSPLDIIEGNTSFNRLEKLLPQEAQQKAEEFQVQREAPQSMMPKKDISYLPMFANSFAQAVATRYNNNKITQDINNNLANPLNYIPEYNNTSEYLKKGITSYQDGGEQLQDDDEDDWEDIYFDLEEEDAEDDSTENNEEENEEYVPYQNDTKGKEFFNNLIANLLRERGNDDNSIEEVSGNTIPSTKKYTSEYDLASMFSKAENYGSKKMTDHYSYDKKGKRKSSAFGPFGWLQSDKGHLYSMFIENGYNKNYNFNDFIATIKSDNNFANTVTKEYENWLLNKTNSLEEAAVFNYAGYKGLKEYRKGNLNYVPENNSTSLKKYISKFFEK